MFLKIAGAYSAEQSGIRGVKMPFDPNIICLNYITFFFGKTVGELVKMW